MALHGTVSVNGGHLSRWWAERAPGGEGTRGWNTYNCGWVSGGGGLTEHFKVRHHYEDGPEKLASLVLAAIPYRQTNIDRWGSATNPDPNPLT